MEHTNNMEIAVTDDNLYQTMQDSNLDDATIRRMKNRERQRRYRARKRLEADTMNEISYPSLKRHEGNANNMQMVPVPQEVYYTSNNGSKAASPDGQLVLARINELPLVVTTTPNIETRVPSRRDWKSDARRANSEELDNRRFSLDIGSKMGSFSSVIMQDVPLHNNNNNNHNNNNNNNNNINNNNNNGESSLSISESGEMKKSGPGRRNWKTEARNRS